MGLGLTTLITIATLGAASAWRNQAAGASLKSRAAASGDENIDGEGGLRAVLKAIMIGSSPTSLPPPPPGRREAATGWHVRAIAKQVQDYLGFTDERMQGGPCTRRGVQALERHLKSTMVDSAAQEEMEATKAEFPSLLQLGESTRRQVGPRSALVVLLMMVSPSSGLSFGRPAGAHGAMMKSTLTHSAPHGASRAWSGLRTPARSSNVAMDLAGSSDDIPLSQKQMKQMVEAALRKRRHEIDHMMARAARLKAAQVERLNRKAARPDMEASL